MDEGHAQNRFFVYGQTKARDINSVFNSFVNAFVCHANEKDKDKDRDKDSSAMTESMTHRVWAMPALNIQARWWRVF